MTTLRRAFIDITELACLALAGWLLVAILAVLR